jgi:hypothetical protein
VGSLFLVAKGTISKTRSEKDREATPMIAEQEMSTYRDDWTKKSQPKAPGPFHARSYNAPMGWLADRMARRRGTMFDDEVAHVCV